MNRLLLTTSSASRLANYAQARRDTLNFETLGGDRGCDVEAPKSQAPKSRRWLWGHERRYVVVEVHKERDMSEDINEGKARVPRVPTFAKERREVFAAKGTISAVVTTRSGDVTVRASQGEEISVVLGTNKSSNEELLEEARVLYDEARGTLEIETLPHGGGLVSGGLRAAIRGDWFSLSGGDLDVVVTLPQGSDLQVTTASGDTVVGVALADVKVSSASGDVVALDTFDALDVRTASGDVRAGRVLSRLRCKSASGDLSFAGAAEKTEIASASGDVEVTATLPGSLSVNSASGDVVVHVVSGLAVDVAGNTLSGRLGSEIDLSATGDDAPKAQISFIKVNTVSGDILIDRA